MSGYFAPLAKFSTVLPNIVATTAPLPVLPMTIILAFRLRATSRIAVDAMKFEAITYPAKVSRGLAGNAVLKSRASSDRVEFGTTLQVKTVNNRILINPAASRLAYLQNLPF